MNFPIFSPILFPFYSTMHIVPEDRDNVNHKIETFLIFIKMIATQLLSDKADVAILRIK
jgi:hypothetical protein